MTDHQLPKAKKSGAGAIFITGAGSGIGAATARLFAKNGWSVGLADHQARSVEALAAELGTHAHWYEVDVLDRSALDASMAHFDGATEGMSVLFNSAGLLDMRAFEEADCEKVDTLLDVNIKGVVNSIRSALPFVSKQKNARIITMSSAAAIYGVPDLAAYSASKFAVRGLTEALNLELENKGIWVCDVMVGYVATPMISNAEARARSVDLAGVHVTPEDVAATVLQALSERKLHWFVRPEDREALALFDATDVETRRELMRPSTGY